MNSSVFNNYIHRINEFFIQYGGYTSLVLYVILAYTWFTYNPFGLVTRYNAIAIVATLVIGYFVMMTANFAWARGQFFGQQASSPSLSHWFGVSGSAVGILFAVGVILYAVFLLISNFGRFISILIDMMYYLAIIGALGILYKVLAPLFSNVKAPAFVQLIKNVVFYIPCIFINFFDNIAGTKKSIWLLLLAEIAIIAIYFLLPILLKSNYLKIGTVLTREPQYLNNPVSFDLDALREITEKSKSSLHYALVADIWINPQPTSTSLAYTKDTNIISFGDRLQVEYNGKTPTELIVKAMEGRKTVIVSRPKIALQKWNKLVLNYDHGTLDIFVNGKLIHSKQNVPFVTLATVFAGSQDGIHGGIKDIRYFDKPLTKNQIDMLGVI